MINPHEDFAKRKRTKVFYRELYDWLYERPRGSIESLLPPLSVHPVLDRHGPMRYEGVVAGLVMVGLDSAVLTRLPHGLAPGSEAGSFSLAVGLVIGVMAFAGFRLAWLELRDLGVRSKLQERDSA